MPKCKVCKTNTEFEFTYAHCRNCLECRRPSDIIKVLIFKTHTEMYCAMCGKPVASSNGEFDAFPNGLTESDTLLGMVNDTLPNKSS